MTDTCECIPDADVCETESETEGCICVTMELYFCGTGKYNKTICCNPKEELCGGDCEPWEYWDEMDSSGLCTPMSEEDYYAMKEENTEQTDGFVEAADEEDEEATEGV